jgi:PAS domain S-box-containing protein
VRFHRKKDGTVFPVEITARPLTLKGGLCLLVAARDITERRQMEEVHSFLAQTTGTANEPFFNVLARYLAHTLGMDYVCIDRLERDGLTAHTVAVWCDGHFEDNVRYALHDTPCGDVVGKQVCCFPASVRQCFPRSEVLVGLCAESYVGVTLWDHTGQPIGLITVIGRRPLANRPLVEAVLKLVALRAAGELERLEAEEGLRESEERLSDITYSMADWVWETDANGIYTYSSQKSLDVLGLSQEEIIGKTPFDFMPADEAARVRAICSEVFARKAPIRDLENWHIAKNGERICLLTNGVPILDLEDNLKGYRGVDRNITSRKRAEEELRKSEEKYRFLVENSYDIIYTITAAGLFTFVAPAWTTILGHPTTQVVGRSFESFVHPDDIEECRAFLRRVIETGQRQEGIEYRVQHINGTWRWHTSSAVFIKNAADPFAAFQGIAKDITDRKQAEEARTAPC